MGFYTLWGNPADPTTNHHDTLAEALEAVNAALTQPPYTLFMPALTFVYDGTVYTMYHSVDHNDGWFTVYPDDLPVSPYTLM